jgi:hypothetical protein
MDFVANHPKRFQKPGDDEPSYRVYAIHCNMISCLPYGFFINQRVVDDSLYMFVCKIGRGIRSQLINSNVGKRVVPDYFQYLLSLLCVQEFSVGVQ